MLPVTKMTIRYGKLPQLVRNENHQLRNDGCILSREVQNANRIPKERKSMGSIDRRFFDSLMANKRLSLRALAAKMGLGHSQLSLTFSGARRAQLDECAQLAKILDVPLHDVIEALGVEVKNERRRVPVVGAVHGDGTVELYGSLQGSGIVGTDKSIIIERTTAPDADLPDDTAAIQFRTAGTLLEYFDGAVSFFRRPDGIAKDAFGRLCMVQIKDGPAAVGTIRRGYREGTWNIAGPHQRENAVIEWAAPLLLTRH